MMRDDNHNLMHVPPFDRGPIAPAPGFPYVGFPRGNGAIAGSSQMRWRQFSRVIRRNWPLSLTFIVIFMVVLVIVLFAMKDVYEASARLQILPPPVSESVSLQQMPYQVQNQQDYFQTQIEILESDGLALSVIQHLHLDRNPEISGAGDPGPITRIKTKLGLQKEQGPPPMDAILNNFKSKLSISQVKTSELIDVSFSSHDPHLSSAVTNDLIDTYLERSRRSEYEATMAAAGALSNELNDLKDAVGKANDTLVQYQKQHGIIDTGGSASPGGTAPIGPQSPITDRVAQLTQQLTQAEADRLQQQAYLNMINSNESNSLPQMRDNVVLQDLTRELADTRGQLALALTIYGDNNTNVKKLRNEATELQNQIDLERTHVVNQVKTAYNAADDHEKILRSTIDGLKASLGQADQSLVQYDLLKEEAAAKSTLYVTLSNRLKEIAISGSLLSNNIRVTDRARVPQFPAWPHRMEITAIGFVFSLLAGIALAFVRENFDDTITSIDDVKELTGLPCLGMLPRIGPATRMALNIDAKGFFGRSKASEKLASRTRFFLDRPGSPEAEAVRTLDTSIRLPVGSNAVPRQVLLIVSPFPSEGKTTIAVNLAIALSKHGKACLVDADLRNPEVGRAFPIGTRRGLRDVLVGNAVLAEVLQPAPRIETLSILPAGIPAEQPAELLASRRMDDVVDELRNQFTYVVVDSPPVIPFADARWLSRLVDGVILVARSGATTRQAVGLASDILKEIHAPILGVVLNGVDLKSEYYSYGYYGRGKYEAKSA
jgi:succinoglycan biosynthesis transport protein ExoP